MAEEVLGIIMSGLGAIDVGSGVRVKGTFGPSRNQLAACENDGSP